MLGLSLGLWAASAAQGGGLPRFEEYPVKAVFHGAPAKPVLSTQLARRFRTQIREAAAKGPNFAGSYRVAAWGCGTGCLEIAVIDERDGTLHSGPFQDLDVGGTFRYADGTKWDDEKFEPLSYRLGSRLFVARGCPDNGEQKNCALYYYEWTGSQFRLIVKKPAIGAPPAQ